MLKQTDFYVISQDLSVIKCDSFEDCVNYEDFLYAIQEEAEDIEAYSVKLLNASGEEFTIEENAWKVTAIKAERLQKGRDTAQTYVSMVIADSLGNEDVISANRKNYKGILQIHQILRYLSLSPDWNTANKRQHHISLKKLFTRLKNGRSVNCTIQLNPDEDFSVNLSFENELYVMYSCIQYGDFFMEYKNEEKYTNADFYQFIKFVLNKFPKIDLDAY